MDARVRHTHAMRPEVVAIAGLLASGCAGRTVHRAAGDGSAQASIDAATGDGSAPDPSGLREATRSPCAMVEQTLAAGGSPIERRDCAAMIAGHRVTAAPRGRREALIAYEWCVRHGAGALGATSVQWNANGLMRWQNGEACWTLDGGRLTWTLDGVAWRALALGWRGGAELVAGGQRLAPCPPERPERPAPID